MWVLLGSMFGGFIAILALSILIEMGVKRIVDSATFGKTFSVAMAWIIATAIVYLQDHDAADVIFTYLPGAIILGFLGYMRGLKLDRAARHQGHPEDASS